MSSAKHKHVDPAPVVRDWSKPQQLDALTRAFGPARIDSLLPSMTDIPKEFHRNAWSAEVWNWFFSGVAKDAVIVAKPGIERADAIAHIAACLRSFEPRHEHKTAGCAYLMSLWFDRFGDAGKAA